MRTCIHTYMHTYANANLHNRYTHYNTILNPYSPHRSACDINTCIHSCMHLHMHMSRYIYMYIYVHPPEPKGLRNSFGKFSNTRKAMIKQTTVSVSNNSNQTSHSNGKTRSCDSQNDGRSSTQRLPNYFIKEKW